MRETWGEERQAEKLRNMIEASERDPDYWGALNFIAARLHKERRLFPHDLADWASRLHKGEVPRPRKLQSNKGQPHYANNSRDLWSAHVFSVLQFLGLTSKMECREAIAVACGVGLALATVVLVATHAVHAAEAQRGGGRGGRGAWMGGPGGAGPAGAFLPPLRRLDLTDEQREQVRTAIGESREAARTHARETRTARQALAEAVTTGAVDEDRLRTLGAEQGRLAGDGAVGRAQVYAAVWQILTPEQQARAEEIRAAREERRNARRERMEERRERMRERREERRERRNR